MGGVIAVSLSTVALMLAEILFKPSVKIKNHSYSIFWVVPLCGAALMLVLKLVNIDAVLAAFTSSDAINPLKILALFFSMTALSVYLDEVGFFKYLASLALAKSRSSQKKLFLTLYVLVSVLTVFTSNDIVILTFTPFICCFCARAKIDPLPYLVAEFVGANTWSMALVIGNPTNIYLATCAGVDFVEYFSVMALPTLLSGTVSFLMLYLLFRKKLSEAIGECDAETERLSDKTGVVIGLVHLSLCTVLLAVSSYIGLDMWYISLGFCLSLFIITLSVKAAKKESARDLQNTVKRIPWALAPFVLSMFVIVLALGESGASAIIAEKLNGGNLLVNYGLSSYLAANLINNIPMSVLYGSLVSTCNFSASALYPAVVGSNLGAVLTPIGALAGIMWSGILKRYDVKFSFLSFIKYGAAISVPSLLAALLGLLIVL